MSQITVMMPCSEQPPMIAWGVAAWVRRRAESLRLVQIPNHRSSHVQPTPNGGGLGIVVAGSLAGVGLVLFSGWVLCGFVLGFAAVLAAVGLRDDMAHLPARVWFGVRVVVCAGLLFALGDLPELTLSGAGITLGGVGLVWAVVAGWSVIDQPVQLHGWHRRDCWDAGGIHVTGRCCDGSVGQCQGGI